VVESAGTSTNFWGWFLDKVAPPVLAGLVIAIVGSYLLPRANERYKGQRDHLNQTVENLRAQLDTFQRVAAEYWAEPPGATSRVQEADLEFRLQDIASLFAACAPELGTGVENPTVALALETVTQDFGTPSRPAEPDRARLISVLAARIATAAAIGRRQYFFDSGLLRLGKSLRRLLNRDRVH
jgi:hypothetical protein